MAASPQMRKQQRAVLALHRATCFCMERCNRLICFRLTTLMNALVHGRHSMDPVAGVLDWSGAWPVSLGLVCFCHVVPLAA